MYRLLAAALLLIQVNVSRPSTIEGLVVKSGNGDPIALAAVELSRQGDGRGKSVVAGTDADGKFIFRNIAAGVYRITATRPGFVRSEYGQRRVNGFPGGGLDITVADGQDFRNARIPLTETAAIYGRVAYANGKPVPNANVTAYQYEYQNGRRGLEIVKQAATNDLGEYRLFWLPPGSYILSATPGLVTYVPAGASNSERIAAGNPIPLPDEDPPLENYFPGTLDIAAATAISLRPADNRGGTDIIVSPVHGLSVRGVVLNRFNSSTIRTGVSLRSRNSALSFYRNDRSALVDSTTGKFEIHGVPPGSYYLTAETSRDTDDSPYRHARIEVDIGDKDVENLTISLQPVFDLAVHVSIDGRLAEAGEMESMEFILEDFSGWTDGGGPAKLPSPGVLVFTRVPIGDYRFGIFPPFVNSLGLYMKSVKFGGIDLMRDELHLDMSPTQPIEVLLGAHPASVFGHVVNGKLEPQANIGVVLVPDVPLRKVWGLFKSTSTGASGDFQFKRLAPGDYKIFSWENAKPGIWHDPEFLLQYESRGTSVHVDEGGNLTVQVTSIVVPEP